MKKTAFYLGVFVAAAFLSGSPEIIDKVVWGGAPAELQVAFYEY